QYSFGGIPFLFLGTNQIIFIIIILLYIFSGMAFASLSSETSLGVKVTEGNGKLPKVVLSFVDGRSKWFKFKLRRDLSVWHRVTSWKVANGKDTLFVRSGCNICGEETIGLTTSISSHCSSPCPVFFEVCFIYIVLFRGHL
ncbi:hypothetical protein IFM89_011050, partial [Coptis chinensis]